MVVVIRRSTIYMMLEVICYHLAYTIVFYFLSDITGAAFAISMLPMLISAYRFQFRGVLASFIILLPLVTYQQLNMQEELTLAVKLVQIGVGVGSTTTAGLIIAWVRKLKNELAVAHAAIYQAAKIKDLGDMASGVAHELNNPLAIVSGNLQLIETLGDVDKNKNLAAKALIACERMAKIIRNLRSYENYDDHEEFVEIDLNEVLKECHSLENNRLSARKIDLKIDYYDQKADVQGSAKQLEIVFKSLLSNAIECFENSIKDGPAKISVNIRKSSDVFIINIDDNGPGMSRKVLNKIFDPFFTTKEVGQGTGLGLYVCKSLIKNHGGSLEIESNSDGTRVCVSLPAA